MDFYTVAILQGLGYGAMGLGIYISLRIFNIPDITTDGSYTLGGAITAISLVSGYSPVIALLLSLAGGMLAGISTGLIHTKLKVNALLAGILVMTALYSINLVIMGRSNVPVIDVKNIFSIIGTDDNSIIKMTVVLLIFIAILVLFITWLLRTDLGLAMRATGNSEQMVKSGGVNTSYMKIGGLALANGLTALSGYMLVQYQGFADISMGIGIVISGLASVMIGESITRMFRFNSIALQVISVIAGSIIFRLILAFTLSLGLNPNYLKLTTSVIVLAVLSVSRMKKSFA
jgi:putative tryptophan/tyrosine transport system permease protein